MGQTRVRRPAEERPERLGVLPKRVVPGPSNAVEAGQVAQDVLRAELVGDDGREAEEPALASLRAVAVAALRDPSAISAAIALGVLLKRLDGGLFRQARRLTPAVPNPSTSMAPLALPCVHEAQARAAQDRAEAKDTSPGHEATGLLRRRLVRAGLVVLAAEAHAPEAVRTVIGDDDGRVGLEVGPLLAGVELRQGLLRPALGEILPPEPTTRPSEAFRAPSPARRKPPRRAVNAAVGAGNAPDVVGSRHGPLRAEDVPGVAPGRRLPVQGAPREGLPSMEGRLPFEAEGRTGLAEVRLASPASGAATAPARRDGRPVVDTTRPAPNPSEGRVHEVP